MDDINVEMAKTLRCFWKDSKGRHRVAFIRVKPGDCYLEFGNEGNVYTELGEVIEIKDLKDLTYPPRFD